MKVAAFYVYARVICSQKVLCESRSLNLSEFERRLSKMKKRTICFIITGTDV